MMHKRKISTTCAYCGVGCGLDIVTHKRRHQVYGDPTHPANLGSLCRKGGTLGQTMGHDGRLLFPSIDGSAVNWGKAITYVGHEFKRLIDEYGNESIGFYISGQMLTEDYYVANKLMKGYIGTSNIDTNSRLCMASTVVGHKRAFGEDLVPACYEDLELAELVLIVGSNMASCHPVLFERLKKAKTQLNSKIVVVDPRVTDTTAIADLHLPLACGTDVALFNGLLKFLKDQGQLDFHYMEFHTTGIAKTLAVAEQYTIPMVAKICELPERCIVDFYRLVSNYPRTVTVFSQGVNQSSSGTDKVNAIINFHLATGRIGKPGSAPFSLTGQNNAMGGREVGGLANQLAAHMDVRNPEHRSLVQEYWDSPCIPEKNGWQAIDMFDRCLSGEIKAIWIMATNPIVSLPNSGKVAAALKACKLVIVSECFSSSATLDFADVIFPASTWGEKDGMVTNSERCISRQRSFTSPPGDARADWWIICQVAKAMGYIHGFEYKHAAEIFREYAGLTAYKNNGQRCLNLSHLTNLSREEYMNFRPQQWPLDSQPGEPNKRLFTDGKFFHADGKAKFIPVEYKESIQKSLGSPLILTTGRVHDQWHTMTRTSRVASLNQSSDEPLIIIHPDDLRKYNITGTPLVEVESKQGNYIGKYRVDLDIKPGHIFIPFHWQKDYGEPAKANRLTAEVCDPYSGQPEYKLTPVDIKPYFVLSHGFIATRRPLNSLQDVCFFLTITAPEFARYELGFIDNVQVAMEKLKKSLDFSNNEDWVFYHDPGGCRLRAACFVEGKIESMIHLAGNNNVVGGRDKLTNFFKRRRIKDEDRLTIFTP